MRGSSSSPSAQFPGVSSVPQSFQPSISHMQAHRFNPPGLPDMRALSLQHMAGEMPLRLPNMHMSRSGALHPAVTGVSSANPLSSFTRMPPPPPQQTVNNLNQQIMNNILYARTLATLGMNPNMLPFNEAVLSAALAIVAANGTQQMPLMGMNPHPSQSVTGFHPTPSATPVYAPAKVVKVDDIVNGNSGTMGERAANDGIASSFYSRHEGGGHDDVPTYEHVEKEESAYGKNIGKKQKTSNCSVNTDTTAASGRNGSKHCRRRQTFPKIESSSRQKQGQDELEQTSRPVHSQGSKFRSNAKNSNPSEPAENAQRQPKLKPSKIITMHPTDASGGGMVVLRKGEDGHLDVRVVYLREFMLQCASSPHALLPPRNLQKMVKEMNEMVIKFPSRFHSSRHIRPRTDHSLPIGI